MLPLQPHVCLDLSIRKHSVTNSISFQATAAETIDGEGLFAFEKVQLTERVISQLSNQGLVGLKQFSFEDFLANTNHSQKCKTYPDDKEWPSEETWQQFNTLLGGALIRTVPEAAICYRNGSVVCDMLAAINFSERRTQKFCEE